MFVFSNNSDSDTEEEEETIPSFNFEQATTPKQFMNQILNSKNPAHLINSNYLLLHAVRKCKQTANIEQVALRDDDNQSYQEWFQVCEDILKIEGIDLNAMECCQEDYDCALSLSIEAPFDLKLVELFLSSSGAANPNICSGFRGRYNMINFAIKSKSMEILKLLCRYGADVNSFNPVHGGRFSSLNYAYENDEIEMLNYLLSIPQVSLRESRLFHTACEIGDVNMVQRLISNHFQTLDLNFGNFTTPLFEACENQHVEIVKLLVTLLPAGLDINLGSLERRSSNRTPLNEAIRKLNRAIVSILIANGANISTEDQRSSLESMGINLYQLKFELQPVSNFQKKLLRLKNDQILSDMTIITVNHLYN